MEIISEYNSISSTRWGFFRFLFRISYIFTGASYCTVCPALVQKRFTNIVPGSSLELLFQQAEGKLCYPDLNYLIIMWKLCLVFVFFLKNDG